MDLNPDSAWRTDPVAIRPWAPTLSQHGLQQVVVRNLNGPRPRPHGTSKDEPVRGSRRPKSQAKMAGFGRAVHVDDHPQWSGAVATEERRGVTGQRPSAVVRRALPGGGGSGSTDEWTAATVGVQCRPGTLSPSWGRQCPSRSSRSGADSEQPRQVNGEGGGAAAPAQWPGGPSPGAAAPAQPGE